MKSIKCPYLAPAATFFATYSSADATSVMFGHFEIRSTVYRLIWDQHSARHIRKGLTGTLTSGSGDDIWTIVDGHPFFIVAA